MWRFLVLFLLLALSVEAKFKKNHLRTSQHDDSFFKPSQLAFIGCPYNNDFYYNGTIYSPLWPKNYPPNDMCYYYMQAAPGKVLSFDFPHFDLETCCDYVTIYDGQNNHAPILARYGGPNMTAPVPTGTVYSSTRFALVTFTSDKQNEQSGFQMDYKSVFTATPCNRDIVLTINGMSGVGSQDNFVKQLNFFANMLTPTWQVAQNKVRAMINLQVDDDFAVVYTSTDVPNNQILTQTILGLTDDVPNVMENNNTSVNSLFRYSEDAVSSFGTKEFGERSGIDRVAIIVIPQNPNDDQDYNAAFESAHKARTTDDSRLIVISIGANVDSVRLGQLAQSSAAAFHIYSFDDLSALVSPINTAICEPIANSCGP